MVAVAMMVGLLVGPTGAVTSKITRQATGKQLLEGKTENVVISSRGTIQLGRAAKVLASNFDDVWSVNSIVASGGTVYIGTSPNGSIYKYRLGAVTKIYPTEGQSSIDKDQPAVPKAPPSPEAAEEKDEAGDQTVEKEELFSNEHIFAMAIDVAGRLVVGISGNKCRLCRYETGTMETIFEPDDAKYIFAIETDNVGNLYLGTGPEGKIYVLDPSGKVAQLVYDSPDKNILSLAAGKDGFVYAGSDTRGLVYKINPRNKSAPSSTTARSPRSAHCCSAAKRLAKRNISMPPRRLPRSWRTSASSRPTRPLPDDRSPRKRAARTPAMAA